MGVLLRALTAILAVLAVAAPAFGATDPRRDEQWGLDMVEAPAAWPTTTGVGAVVAVIDTGVQADHPDLAGRLTGGHDFVDKDDKPQDGDGHGTHVTGIIAADADNGEGIAGVAPGARVMPMRVLGDDGTGTTDDAVAAIERAIADGAHVINLSFGAELPVGGFFDDPAFESAIRDAVDAGIVVVLAAGNSSLPTCENPQLEGALCVGAVDPRRQRSVFSSFGQGVDLMAPGGSGFGGSSEDVLSTYPPDRYASLAGTSQATPHVAGVAALLASLGVRGKAAAQRILDTAVNPAPGDPQYGAGIVDARAAVAGLAPPPPAESHGSFTTSSTVKRRAVRRHGFRVKCRAVRPGRCAVRAYYRGHKIAIGGGDVPADLATRVAARLNRRGKRTLNKMGRKVRVKLLVALPGEAARGKRVTIKRSTG